MRSDWQGCSELITPQRGDKERADSALGEDKLSHISSGWQSSLTPALCVPHANNGAVIRQPVTKLQGSFAHQHFWGEKTRGGSTSPAFSSRNTSSVGHTEAPVPRQDQSIAWHPRKHLHQDEATSLWQPNPSLPPFHGMRKKKKREKGRVVKENLQIMGETHRERERQNRWEAAHSWGSWKILDHTLKKTTDDRCKIVSWEGKGAVAR